MDMLRDNEESILELHGCLLTKECHGAQLERTMWRVYDRGSARLLSSIASYALSFFSEYVGMAKREGR